MTSTGDSVDMLASGRDPDRPQALRAAPATALTTALSLVLAGGVVTAAVRGSSGAADPATLVPSTAFAFAEVDLGLGQGQQQAVSRLLDHFPDSPTRSSGSLRDTVLRAMFRDSHDPKVDYDRDVRPWLGNRVAVAAWLDQGRPQVEFLLRSTDDAAARRSLHKLAPTSTVTFTKGFAVLARSRQAADAALAAAKASSLAESSTYRGDVASLGSGQIVTGWVDGAGAVRAMTSAMRGMNPVMLMPFGSAVGSSMLRSANGRVVLGVHATGTYAELVLHQVGSTTPAPPQQPSSLLTQLPDHTIGAAEVVAPGRGAAAVTSGVLAKLGEFRARAPLSAQSNDQTALAGDPLGEVRRVTGLSLPGDIETLLGPAAVVAYGGLQPTGLPKVAVRGRPADLGAAQTLAEHSADVLRRHVPFDLAVTPAGTDLVLATSTDYAAEIARGGALGSDPSFQTAMGGLPAAVGFAAYVRLADVLPLVAHGQRDADHLDAVGMWSAHTDGGEWFQLRLVAR